MAEFDVDGAGRIILFDLCGGDALAAIELLNDTRDRCQRLGVLTPRGAEQLEQLTQWVIDFRGGQGAVGQVKVRL